MLERNYEVCYRTRGEKGANITSCMVTACNKKEARKNFTEFDNANKEWTITEIITR